MDLVKRFDVYLVALNPTRGSEIQKTRPCLVVSPNELNDHLRTVIVAPLTTTMRRYPTRVSLSFQKKKGRVALDQIRTIDKSRLIRRLGKVSDKTARAAADVLTEMFAHP